MVIEERDKIGTVMNEEGEAEPRQLVLKKERFRIDVRRNFFTDRVVDIWNHLPDHIKNATNVNMFKTRIEAYLRTNSLMSLE